MTKSKIELAREIARRSPTRIVEIERTTRFTAYRNMLKTQEAEAIAWAKKYKPCPALLREQRRLIKTWSK